MVTWGQNQSQSYDPRAPAAGTPSGGLFGSPSPAPSGGGLFGSSAPAPSGGFSFGSPSPAPSGGLFGSSAPTPSGGGFSFGSPSPAPSGGLFGSSSPAPSGGLFGSSPAPSGGLFGSSTPAPSGGLFGSTPAPSGGLFGSSPAPGGSLFGGTPAAATAPPQIPAQAAMQAHYDAQARQDEAKVRDKLQKIHQAYTGTAPATEKSSHFVSILYNPTTPQQRQEQLLQSHGLGGGPRPIVPPKPPQVSEDAWMTAVVRTPHHTDYAPVALVGATALQGRLSGQQEQANSQTKHLGLIRDIATFLKGRADYSATSLQDTEAIQKALERRLLRIMGKVEVLRCFRTPLGSQEVAAVEKLSSLHKQVKHLGGLLSELRAVQSLERRPPEIRDVPDAGQLKQVFGSHRASLSKMVYEVHREKSDMELVLERVSDLKILRGQR